MRHSIIFAALLAMACADGKYKCSVDGDCPTGTACDPDQKLCYIPGGCTDICKSNEKCVAAVCVAQSCPVCNANETCDDTTFKCVAVTQGTISLVSPAAGGVIGGPSATVTARAGAPNGGPLHVDFELKTSGGTTISTVSVATGDAQGNYTGTLDLSTATTSTGNTLVATLFWKDASGTTQQTPTGATTVTIDKTAPSITGITTDHAFYSTVANPSGTATVTATIADSGGSSGVSASSVSLTVGTNAPIAGALQTGSATVFQFAVPLTQLAAGANSITISAADVVNNTGTQTSSIDVDNTAPVFGTTSVPTAFFACGDTVSPAITAAITDTGGAGVDGSSLKLKVDTTHQYAPNSFASGTATWNSLHGSDFAADGSQGAVAFTFIGSDTAGNPATPSSQSLNVDCKAPLVNTVAGAGTTTWSARTGTVTVTAVVDDTGGSGPASAALQVNGQNDVAGTTGGTGSSRTYTFSVPATYQTAGSETPVPFDIVGTDAAGNTTATASAGTGTLLIDDLGPSVTSITVNGGTALSGTKWFKEAASGDVDVQADIVDHGSGVKTSTLTLINTADSTRLDHGTPACGTPAGDGTVTCHFTVALSKPGAGSQQLYNFKVGGTDNVSNAMQSTVSNTANAGKVGIDGAPPTVAFTVSSPPACTTVGTATTSCYPAAGSGCNGGTLDAALFCGHDGKNFWRAGETNPMAFTADDGGSTGSGVDSTTAGYTIAGSTNCPTGTPCPATDATGGRFTFTPDFSSASFASGADGTGTVTVTVTASDAVGNTATKQITTVAVSRVKWVRSMASKVDTFKGSPVVTSQPSSQIIFAGAERDTSGPLVSFSPDGTVLWRGGHSDATTISNNVAYSSATKRLYVLGDSATHLFVYDVGNVAASVAPQLYSCLLDDGLLSSGQAVGAPAILAGSPEHALVGDTGEHRLWAFAGSGAGCSIGGSTSTNSSTAWTGNINPPTTDGTNVYLGHDTNKLAKVPFSGGAFGTVTEAASFTIPIFGPVSIAGPLFFGDRNATPNLYAYDAAALTSIWTTTSLGDSLNAAVVVGPSFAFGAPQSGDGQLHAYNKSNPNQGVEAFHWLTTGAKIGNISAPSLGADGTIYFTNDGNKELVALKVTGSTPAAQTGWSSTFKGSATQVIGATNTSVDGLGTEPTIDSSGVLYFATGTSLGKVYAIITDSGGPLTPSAGSTWPRVGYDNCNSSNTAFTCQ